MKVYKSSQSLTQKPIYTLLHTPNYSRPNETACFLPPLSLFVSFSPASNPLYPLISPPGRRCQHSLKCPPDPRSSLLTSIPLQPIVQSNPCLKSWLREWFLSWANRRSGGHDHRGPSSLSQTIKSGLFMRIWGLHPTVLLLPQGFSVVFPVRAVISCSWAPSSSSGLRMM